jgi:hypothetical protein
MFWILCKQTVITQFWILCKQTVITQFWILCKQTVMTQFWILCKQTVITQFYVLLIVHLIYPCNKNQLDALFILSLFRQSTSTCFGHICSPSSGGMLYTGCPRGNVPDFGRVFLMLSTSNDWGVGSLCYYRPAWPILSSYPSLWIWFVEISPL